MFPYILALVIGFSAGLRTMTAPAAVSWAVYLGWLPLSGSWASFLGYWMTPYVFSAIAVFEFVADQLPSTPSRKVPQQFGARIVSGAFCGAAIGAAGGTVGGSLTGGLIAGAAGAVLGTLGGYEARKRLVAAIGGNDMPIALMEDAAAVLLALWVVSSHS